MTERRPIHVIGGGLAGSEAAWQIASTGVPVVIYEMRPERMTDAQTTDAFCELVCSNSFRGADSTNAVGLLKEELRRAGSLILAAADATRVPAGGALAVDREAFSAHITERLRAHPRVRIEARVVETHPRGAGDRRHRPAHGRRARRRPRAHSWAASTSRTTTRSRPS